MRVLALIPASSPRGSGLQSRPARPNARTEPVQDPKEDGGSTLMLPGWFSLITHFTLWSDQFYNLVAKDLQLCSFYRFMGLHQLHR